MAKEKMESEDKVSIVLLDKDGNVKARSEGKKRKSRTLRFIEFVERLLK